MSFSNVRLLVGALALVHPTLATTLSSICTSDYAKNALPNDVFGLTVQPNSLTAKMYTNYTASGSFFYPDASFDYCNVTFAYIHTGRNDTVQLTLWLPDPAKFANRWLSTGGGAYQINSGASSLSGGVSHGAASGETDGGFGSFSASFDSVFLLGNGSINYESLYMFAYQAHRELSLVGKAFTRKFYNMGTAKLYSYYQGCSEGGREGFSQVQRFGDEWDGVALGAPAFRFGFQQPLHLFGNIVEKTIGYVPPTCEFDYIVNATIAACDALDGKKDGVISRTDLCKLHFDLNSLVGKPYYCAASTGGGGFGGTGGPGGAGGAGGPGGAATGSSTSGSAHVSTGIATGTSSVANPTGTSSTKVKRQFGGGASTPAQNGTVTAKGVLVAKTFLAGLRDLEGRQVYLSYQPGAGFNDAEGTYNTTTGKWDININGGGGGWVTKFLQLMDVSNLSSLDGVTYDTLRDWMILGYQMYASTLHTAWSDLWRYHNGGGKIIHFHGESDGSVPTASSVRYWEAVRKTMYPKSGYNSSTKAMNDWYRLFLVPGAGHCATNPLQPNGPFPNTNLKVLIDWVEKGDNPQTLPATVLSGDLKGSKEQLCAWPLRPLWSNNGRTMKCVYDQKSIDSWMYTFDGDDGLPVA